VPQDETLEASDPWLRHDPDDAGPVASPWLAPDLAVAQPPSGDVVEDTGVPPTLVEDEPVPAIGEPAQGMPWTRVGRGAEPSVVPPVAAARVPDEPARVPDEPAHASQPDAADAAEETNGRRGRSANRRDAEPAGGLAVIGAAVKEFAIVVGMALVLSFIVKTWFLQAFYIPSGSMEDTLRINDRVIVSKLTPGPFDLKRGDIIVFGDPGEWVDPPVEEQHGKVATAVRDAMMFVGLLPDDSENHLIKRVIGLPGDHVVCCDKGGRLTVNGQPVVEPYLKPGVAPSDQDFDITVPRGRVWVMGDNRSGSADSRAHDGPDNDGRLGSVDERLIVGRAVALVWPLDHLTWLSNPTDSFKGVPAPKHTGAEESPPAGADPGSDVPPASDGATTGGGEVEPEGGG
jgi:signal peptidase I